MADLVRGFDWGSTSVGPIELWPDTLLTTVNMLLASRHPMFLWWGPELIQFYNDGYRPSIRADKHPGAVGQRGAECWPEIWPIVGPQIEQVMTEGRSTWHKNQLVPINRDGKLEEVYWTYGYSPVRTEDGAVQGTLVVCTETTEQVLSERRQETLLAITGSAESETPASPPQAVANFIEEIMAAVGREPADIPFAALYQVNGSEVLRLGATPKGSRVCESLETRLREVVRTKLPMRVTDLDRRMGEVVCKPWPEPVTRAYALPLEMQGTPLQAVLVFGISPRLPFDKSYETFFQLVGAKVAGLLHSEMQRFELVRAATRFNALAAADPFGMVIGTFDGRLKYINPGLRKRLGYSEDEVRSGKVRWDRLTPPEYAKADADAVKQLQAKGSCEVYEKVYVAKDGRPVPILIGASVIDTPEGHAEVAAFVTDLTPLKKAEAALRQANDELEGKVAERTAALEAEVAERKRMEMSLRELTGRVLNLRDEERRHMARELHDNAGQTLVALTMKLGAIKAASAHAPGPIRTLASEAKEFSDALSTEIRTLSYLLHPPLLDEAGLESALRWYVEGFTERSRIRVELELPKEMERLPREIELALFRVVQESLTNVHRHSASPTAKISLTRLEDRVRVEISDRGKGIPEEKQRNLTAAKAGVGVRGMQERVRQFGGTMEIVSSGEGTTVVVWLPLGRG
jgi:PAS domain S-box-containing protein